MSALLRGSTARAITGLVKRIGSSSSGCAGSVRVSPVPALLRPGGGDDVAGDRLVDALALVGVHPEEPGDLLLAAIASR